MAGNQELVADPRQFKANATAVLNRADSSSLRRRRRRADCMELYQQHGRHGSGKTSSAIIRIRLSGPRRRRSSKSSPGRRPAAAESSGLSGIYGEVCFSGRSSLPAAQAEIARLEWEAIQNTTDPLQVKRYLDQNPRGQYHERAVTLLDDLTWGETVRRGCGQFQGLPGQLSLRKT